MQYESAGLLNFCLTISENSVKVWSVVLKLFGTLVMTGKKIFSLEDSQLVFICKLNFKQFTQPFVNTYTPAVC